MGVSLDSAVSDLPWPLVVGEEAAVNDGELSSVTDAMDVRDDMAERVLWRAGTSHL